MVTWSRARTGMAAPPRSGPARVDSRADAPDARAIAPRREAALTRASPSPMMSRPPPALAASSIPTNGGLLMYRSAPIALVAVFLLATAAHTAPIPPDQLYWVYNFSVVSSSFLPADGNPSAGIAFSNEPTKYTIGSSDVVATWLTVHSEAPSSSPESVSGDYTLMFLLSTMDEARGPIYCTVPITGKLSGTISSEAANVTNVFDQPTQWASLGDYLFQISLMYFPPGPPIDGEQQGLIGAHVEVRYLRPDTLPPEEGDIAGDGQTPEPSSAVLAGICVLGLAAARRWRRRA